jgi:hypothetical protein
MPGLSKVTIHTALLESLQSQQGRQVLLHDMKASQQFSGTPVIRYTNDMTTYSGRMSFQASLNIPLTIAWFHGFRSYIDTDQMLAAEIGNTWSSRWPIKNNL